MHRCINMGSHYILSDARKHERITMRQNMPGSTTRRTFVKGGLLSAGALVGTASTREAETTATPEPPIERGAMRVYQYTPNSRVTVRESIDRHPQGLEEATGYAVAYDAAPSYRALLFLVGDGAESGTDVLEPGESLSLGDVRGTSTASRRYVTIGLETGDG